jgi:bifunctional non-homologous end joining protein LigD
VAGACQAWPVVVSDPADRPRFVVQKHDARRLHYDLRLEADGVLVSWAVPRGPSLDPSVKRLAVHVDDHALDHGHFEGVIPGARHGTGAVIVWDEGTYDNLTVRDGIAVPVAEAVASGHVSVRLEGTKLRGGWSLTRTHATSWILVKRNDEGAEPGRDVTVDAADSVVTGRSLADLGTLPAASASEGGSAPGDAVASGSDGTAAARPEGAAASASHEAAPRAAAWVPPMLAQPATADDAVFRRPGRRWRYERKLDGLRCLAVRSGREVHLWSRNRLPFDHRFPTIMASLGRLGVDDFVLDGEIVAYDGDRTSFSLLQSGAASVRPVLAVFDLVHLIGRDVTDLPLEDRQGVLRQALAGAPADIAVVEGVEGDPVALMAQACASGWEGLVAKRLGDPYRSGRSGGWRKLKCTASQELVVGGWTDPTGQRSGLGALLVGYHDDSGALHYAGRVGTGFTGVVLRRLSDELAGRAAAASPFAEDTGVRGAHWVRPELVVAVAFSEWTPDGRLRHPSFQGLRDDKEAGSVRREVTSPAARPPGARSGPEPGRAAGRA